MRKLLAILVVVGLAGCASKGPKIPERVEVPVPVKCVEKAPEKPGTVADSVLFGLDDYRLVLTMRRDLVLMRDYSAALEAAMAGCL